MTVSEGLLKWIMRLYPPLFFQRIWVKKFDGGFRGVRVKINKSFLNKNYNHSIFGGTIFAAVDPFYPVLFHRIFTLKGYDIRAWSKSSGVLYLKPGRTDLFFDIRISEQEIAEAEDILNTVGKYLRNFPIDVYNTKGEVCVTLINEIYMRNLNFIDTNKKQEDDALDNE